MKHNGAKCPPTGSGTLRNFRIIQATGHASCSGIPNNLNACGRITAELARDHAESEFEKYRIVQDRLFESDFDRLTKEFPGGSHE